ncbi:MAG: hypothetical protein KGI58_01380 [Patescibacteria group bacterium]|nr:hypothetical protein [Patescibacteria group bacterium]
MKDILTSPRMEDLKRSRRKRRLRMVILIFILLITVVYALAFFSSNPKITLNKIIVTGTRIISDTKVESDTRQVISGKYLHLFARDNSLIYPKTNIYSTLIKDFPRIKTLTINRSGWNTLTIDITERLGSYLYCGSQIPTVESNIGENCYFVNNDGYIFDKAPYFSGNVYFKYYAPLGAGEANPLGQQLLTPDRFHKIARFIDGVIAVGFKPTYLVIGNDDDYLYLDHKSTDTSPQIIFNNENDLDQILNNLSLAMTKPEFANVINSKYTTLLYIDLRFKNKVLYKFQ